MTEKAFIISLFICGIVFLILASRLTVSSNDQLRLQSSIDESSTMDDWQCSESDLFLRTARFNEIIKNRMWSSCYTNIYLEKMSLADAAQSDRQNKLFFDVGANKGYTLALWLSTWMPHLNFTQKNLHAFLEAELQINECGACSDCHEEVLNITRENTTLSTTITIHAFEPIESTYEALVRVRRHFNLANVHVHHLAISNSTGVQKIVQCAAGAEICGLVVSPNPAGAATVDVRTTTLDDFVKKNRIKQEIDLLKIDTEGADPLVLDGAKRLFAQERVRMLIFENHHLGAWEQVHLEEVLRSLENKGFICHLIGKTGMIRLTKCWSSIYDIKYWSNVLCVHRRQLRLRHFLNQLLA